MVSPCPNRGVGGVRPILHGTGGQLGHAGEDIERQAAFIGVGIVEVLVQQDFRVRADGQRGPVIEGQDRKPILIGADDFVRQQPIPGTAFAEFLIPIEPIDLRLDLRKGTDFNLAALLDLLGRQFD